MFSNEDLNDIMKIIKLLEDSGLLIKGVTETIENKLKEQKGGFNGHIRCQSIGKYVSRKSCIKSWRKSDSNESRTRNK